MDYSGIRSITHMPTTTHKFWHFFFWLGTFKARVILGQISNFKYRLRIRYEITLTLVISNV